MTTASFNIQVIQPRMFSLKQAADYIGVPVKRFPGVCPVAPTLMPGDVRLYDRADLDLWIDQLKSGGRDNDDDILGKLA